MTELQYISKSLDELREENKEQHSYILKAINEIDDRVHTNTTNLAVIKSRVAMVATLAGLIASATVTIAAAFIK